MGYRSDIAIQFINQEEANKFIRTYAKHPREIHGEKIKNLGYFTEYNEPEHVNEFGEVSYFWQDVKFYLNYPDVKAMVKTLESNKFTCIFIRIGEDEDDEKRHFGQDVIKKPISIPVIRHWR